MPNDELTIKNTPIPGLLVLGLPVHGDARGWFKENWQREKMRRLGLPDFGPVQNNVSFNSEKGVTRGMHAEPWDKLVSLAHGRILGVWADLREGPTFGTTFSVEMGPETAVFVPRGIANGYQSLAENTVYSYLVNDHWSPMAKDSYTYVNLDDETLALPWPIPLKEAIVSEADKDHPKLNQVAPLKRRRTLILGASGQLGIALAAEFPEAIALDRDDLDLVDPSSLDAIDWNSVETVINAAAWTAVDQAETVEGRRAAWELNVNAVSRLVEIARRHRITLVSVSSDYVFDGTQSEHTEDEALSPLGVYGSTKAAADVLVGTLPDHYIARTSWLIGDGHNFVRTMANLARRGTAPSVVDDQFGRLTFATTLASGIKHLLSVRPEPGTYNITNSGRITSWFDVARRVFELTGFDPDSVGPQSTEQFALGRLVSPRPQNSALSLAKIEATGFFPGDADHELVAYLRSE